MNPGRCAGERARGAPGSLSPPATRGRAGCRVAFFFLGLWVGAERDHDIDRPAQKTHHPERPRGRCADGRARSVPGGASAGVRVSVRVRGHRGVSVPVLSNAPRRGRTGIGRDAMRPRGWNPAGRLSPTDEGTPLTPRRWGNTFAYLIPNRKSARRERLDRQRSETHRAIPRSLGHPVPFEKWAGVWTTRELPHGERTDRVAACEARAHGTTPRA